MGIINGMITRDLRFKQCPLTLVGIHWSLSISECDTAAYREI